MMLTRFSLIVMLGIGFAIPEVTPPLEYVRKCTSKLVNDTWKSVGCKVFATSPCPPELLATEQMMCASPYTFTKINGVKNAQIYTIFDSDEAMCFAECSGNERCIALRQGYKVCYLYAAGSQDFGGVMYRPNRDPVYYPRSLAIPIL